MRQEIKYFLQLVQTAVLVTTAAFGQFRGPQQPPPDAFSDLSCTDDGAQFYFSSPLRLKGSDQYPHAKLFRLTEDGFELIDQRPPTGPGSGNVSDWFHVGLPHVSADGTVLLYHVERTCFCCSSCLGVEIAKGIIRFNSGAPPMELEGKVQISRNGKFAVQLGTTLASRLPRLIDLNTRAGVDLPVGSYPVGVMDDGRVLIGEPGKPNLELWSADRVETLPLPAGNGYAFDERLSTFVYQQYPEPVLHIAARDGSARVLANIIPSNRVPSPQMSKDGRLVLYLSALAPGGPAQVHVVTTSDSAVRVLTREDAGIVAATLAGNGGVAFASTADSRLLRIDVGTGAITELVPRTPYVKSRLGGPSPGSLNWLLGAGLSAGTQVATPPLPDVLDDVQVMIGDRAAPLLALTPGEVMFQIPFETPLTSLTLDVKRLASPFEQAPMALDLEAVHPAVISFARETDPAGTLTQVVIHQDFGSLVTQAAPAKPGEIVHVYMTGLGPVAPTLASGIATPVDALYRTVTPPPCELVSAGMHLPPDIPFSGLAPTLIGVYQLSLHLPQRLQPASNPRQSSVTLDCNNDPKGVFRSDSSAFIWIDCGDSGSACTGQ